MSTIESDPVRTPGVHPWTLTVAQALLAWSAALEQVPSPSFPPVLIAMLTWTTVLYGVFWLAVRQHHRAAILTSFSVVWSFAPMFASSQAALGLLSSVLCVAAFAVLFARRVAGISLILDVGAAAMLVVPAVGLVREGFDLDAPRVVDPRPDVPAVSPPAVRPDVYLIVLDGYGRGDVLADTYGYDDGPFLDHLRAQGFSVVPDARSNYGQTSLSITAMLEAQYLDRLLVDTGPGSTDRRPLAHLLDHALVPATFQAAGYEVATVRSPFSMTTLRTVDRVVELFPPLDDYDYHVLGLTMIPVLVRSAVSHGTLRHTLWARHIRWSIHSLAGAIPDDAPPTFLFAHIVSPHPPFVFDAEGHVRALDRPFLLKDGSGWREWSQPDEPDYIAQYVAQLEYVNLEIGRAVDAIVARRRPAVILLTGDHGPGAHLDMEDAHPPPEEIRERYSILLAVRGAEPASTPINAVRSVLRATTGADLPPLPDETYHSTYDDPYDFAPVSP